VKLKNCEATLAAPGTAPIHISLDPASAGAGVDDLLTAMLRANPRVSDLMFSPGREVQVQVNGDFVPVEASGLRILTADDTRGIASHLIGNNKAAIAMLREQGYCDISYALPGLARFRVNVFIQRGSCAVIMRVIPTVVPELAKLGVPLEIKNILELRSGLILVTGPRGCGKSSTLAALVNYINETESCHILTIEDPIEYLHNHKRATVHQRELHSDTPSISQAMRAALRQAPNVIAVGELKDRESMALALDAAESGHLVLSTFNTPNAAKTVERFVSAFPLGEQASVRERLVKVLRCMVCQRLIPRKRNGELIGVFQVVASSDIHDLLREHHAGSKAPHRPSAIDREIERLVRAGVIDSDAALAHSSDPDALSKTCSRRKNENVDVL
jgi:twitching motility protein PilT